MSVESGRTFGRIERRQTAAGARAHVNQPSAGFQGLGDRVDGPRDLWQRALHRFRDSLVFMIDDARNFERGERVQLRSRQIRAFCPQVFDVHCTVFT